MPRLVALASALLAGSALTACTGHGSTPPPRPAWRVTTLPMPPGPPGRLAVRDAARCGNSWYVVGGVFLDRPTADQDSRPAAWRSTDGHTWAPVRITATTYWGQRAILASVACSADHLTVVGARAGGAHGNPRVTTFAQDGRADGARGGLHDVVAAFSQYGGEKATNVGPIAGRPDAPGWLIAGNRTSGPAVWTSDTGVDFTRHEGTPGLADDATFTALAQAATWDGREWVVVGGGSTRGDLDRQPVAWSSPDGERWTRERIDGSSGFDELDRAVATDDGVLAVGLRDDAFGSWRRRDGRWQRGDGFGRLPADAGASPFVASLAGGGAGGYWATTSDGARYALWHSADGDDWQQVDTPAPAPTTAGEHVLSVAAAAAGVVLLSDDGVDGRVWSAPPTD